jgi:hypothetical protein
VEKRPDWKEVNISHVNVERCPRVKTVLRVVQAVKYAAAIAKTIEIRWIRVNVFAVNDDADVIVVIVFVPSGKTLSIAHAVIGLLDATGCIRGIHAATC